MENERLFYDAVSIKIEYQNQHGSGILVPDSNKTCMYLLTAWHCLNCNKNIDRDEIKLSRQVNGIMEPLRLTFSGELFIAGNIDIVALKCTYLKEMPTVCVAQLTDRENVCIVGFPKPFEPFDSPFKRHSLYGKVNELPTVDFIKIQAGQPLETYMNPAHDTTSGFSGSGIFAEKEGKLCLCGIVTNLGSSDGAYGIIIGTAISAIEKSMGIGHLFPRNTSIKRTGSKQQRLTPTVIRQNQSMLENDVLLPWMRNSASYKAVFPQLFVHPSLSSCKLKHTPLLYEDLLMQYRCQNLVISGDAGAGKTTLLRYLYLYQNPAYEFLYLKADSLSRPENELSKYEKCVKAILFGTQKVSKRKLVFLDGIDEAYADNPEKLNDLIITLKHVPHVSVWLGWRFEHYNLYENDTIRSFSMDVVKLEDWNPKMIQKYVSTYAEKTRQPFIAESFDEIISRNEAIASFTGSPFQLTLLIYLIENKDIAPEFCRFFQIPEQTVYGLYSQFFLCWLQKEKNRHTSSMPDDEIHNCLRAIARQLYYKPTCDITYTDSAITDLLTFTSLKKSNPRIATGFYHRSFCAFFCADFIFDAIKSGGTALIQALSHPFKNDITDFVRSAINSVTDRNELKQILNHLTDTYLQIMRGDNNILDSDAQTLINHLPPKEKFYLKNEIIYLITRFPDISEDIRSFVSEAYSYETDPYMKLDFAYGTVLTGPFHIALEYAQSLTPGTEGDFVNRSWTVAFFGDVQANPYDYRDTEKAPWSKARSARLKRFQSNKWKAIRFRILDLPLMYCFYASRSWIDINEEDYKIIEQVAIDLPEYTMEEKAFLKKEKDKLLTEYRKHLFPNARQD